MMIPSQKNTWIEKPEAVKVGRPRGKTSGPLRLWKRGGLDAGRTLQGRAAGVAAAAARPSSAQLGPRPSAERGSMPGRGCMDAT